MRRYAMKKHDLPGIDQQKGLESVQGNVALYEKLLGKFVSQYNNAAQDLESFLAKGTHEEGLRLVHSIKGVAASLGMTELFCAANALETEMINQSNNQDSRANFQFELERVLQGLSAVQTVFN